MASYKNMEGTVLICATGVCGVGGGGDMAEVMPLPCNTSVFMNTVNSVCGVCVCVCVCVCVQQSSIKTDDWYKIITTVLQNFWAPKSEVHLSSLA
jgi:hypothetical protein